MAWWADPGGGVLVGGVLVCVCVCGGFRCNRPFGAVTWFFSGLQTSEDVSHERTAAALSKPLVPHHVFMLHQCSNFFCAGWENSAAPSVSSGFPEFAFHHRGPCDLLMDSSLPRTEPGCEAATGYFHRIVPALRSLVSLERDERFGNTTTHTHTHTYT